jgi:lipopolysaccharide transport system permease protein
MSSAIDMVPGFLVIAIALLVYGILPPLQILLLPAFLVMLFAATLGIGLTLAAWNVRFRDIGYIVPVAIQILLFATPVIYPSNLVPEHWRPFYSLNPMTGLIEGVRWCVLAAPVEGNLVAVSAVSSAALLAAGLVLFSRSERAFADYL